MCTNLSPLLLSPSLPPPLSFPSHLSLLYPSLDPSFFPPTSSFFPFLLSILLPPTSSFPSFLSFFYLPFPFSLPFSFLLLPLFLPSLLTFSYNFLFSSLSIHSGGQVGGPCPIDDSWVLHLSNGSWQPLSSCSLARYSSSLAPLHQQFPDIAVVVGGAFRGPGIIPQVGRQKTFS